MADRTHATVDGGVAAPSASRAPAAEPRYEFVNEDGQRRQVTAAELATLRAEATTRVRAKLRRAKSYAENHRSTHEWFINDVHGKVEKVSDAFSIKTAIAIAVDWRGGVVPPPVGMWGHAIRLAALGEAALTAGDLAEAARLLARADQAYRDSVAAWNGYMDAIQQGGQRLIGELEVVRDVSFAIAITAAVILAAPAVAAVAGSGLVTSVVGSSAGAGFAVSVAGSGVVGAGVGAGLRGGADALGQKVVTGKVDKAKVEKETKRGLREGAVTGVTAGVAAGLGSAVGVGAKGLSMGQQLVRRAVVEGTSNAVGGAMQKATEEVDPTNPLARPPTVTDVLEAGAVGFATGVATAPLGVAGARLAAAGRGKTAKALEIGGAAAVGAGMSLAEGKSWSEAGKAAATAAVTTGALSAATRPSPKQKPTTPKTPTTNTSTEPPKTTTPASTEPTTTGHTPAAPATTKPATTTAEPATTTTTQPATHEPPTPAGKPATEPPGTTPKPTATEPTTPTSTAKPTTATTEPAATAPPTPAPASTTGKPTTAEPHATHEPTAAKPVTAEPTPAAPSAPAHEPHAAKPTAVEGPTIPKNVAEQRAVVARQETALGNAVGRAKRARDAVNTARDDLKAARAKVDTAEDPAQAQDHVTKAEKRLDRASRWLKKTVRWAGDRGKDLKRSVKHLEHVEATAGKSTEAPRQRMDQPLDTDNRRPALREVTNVPENRAASRPGGEPNPEARVRVHRAKVRPDLRARHDALIADARANKGEATALGHPYESLLVDDITPGTSKGVRMESTAGDKKRVSDHGVHEFTLEGLEPATPGKKKSTGALSPGKLDQLWRDLFAITPGDDKPRDHAILTVPTLSPTAERQLVKMAHAYELLTGRRPLVIVRETVVP